MENPASYILSAYSFISKYPLDKLLNVGYQSKDGNPIPSFDENVLINLCSEAEQLFANESNSLEINGDVIIVGDIHGSLHDFLRILKFIQEQNTKVLFLGDYVDRGHFSLECITLLLALKISHPDIFYLIRGNHEFDSTCAQYGFKDEILNYHNPKMQSSSLQMNKSHSSLVFSETNSLEKSNECEENHPFHSDTNCYKYTETLYNAFMKTFSYLPISARINKKTFCIHGGLSPKLNLIDDINQKIQRPIDRIEDSSLLSDVMWSDPSHDINLFIENPRGRGFLFNRESVVKFLKSNSLSRLIRAHQCVQQGVLTHFNDKCITVFSASSYDQPNGNFSSILLLSQQNDTIRIYTFDPLIRLEKSEAFYYKVQPLYPIDDKNHVYFSLLHPKLLSNINVRSLFIKNTKHVRMHKSENSIHNIRNPNARMLQFITNQRKSYNFTSVRKYFSSFPSSPSEIEDISSQCDTENTS